MKRASKMLSVAGKKSVIEYWHHMACRNELIKSFGDKWRDMKLDAMLCPGGSLPAFKHGESADLTIALYYTMLFNVLHFPSGTVPITQVR